MDGPVARPEVPAFGPRPVARVRVLPDVVLGTAIFVAVEMMLFAGFISAHTIIEAAYPPGAWPPPDQPRLPVEVTALTTTMLLASGLTLWRAGRRFASDPAGAAPVLNLAIALGAVFVGVQGVEWVRLISEGLTLSSSTFGAFFYLIVGAHALHAIPALVVLGWAAMGLRKGALTADAFAAVRLFWYFVVLLWPVLYVLVYL